MTNKKSSYFTNLPTASTTRSKFNTYWTQKIVLDVYGQANSLLTEV